jgi:hypothetical protein
MPACRSFSSSRLARSRSPGGSFALLGRLVDPLTSNPVETLLARFAAKRPDGCGKQDVIREAWPRTPHSGGVAARTLGDLTAPSRGDCNRRQPPKHDYKSQAQADVANPHANSSARYEIFSLTVKSGNLLRLFHRNLKCCIRIPLGTAKWASRETQLSSVVFPEQTPIPHVAPDHMHAPVSGLIHD